MSKREPLDPADIARWTKIACDDDPDYDDLSELCDGFLAARQALDDMKATLNVRDAKIARVMGLLRETSDTMEDQRAEGSPLLLSIDHEMTHE